MLRSPDQFFIGFLCFDDIKPHELFVNFGNYSLLVTSFANIFSQSVGCFFILFIVSFAVQKLLSRSYLFIFVFYFHYSGRQIEKDNCYMTSTSEEGGMA